jgi:hypothetical protein
LIETKAHALRIAVRGEWQIMHAIAAKALIVISAAIAVGAGVALFTIARQDGSKTGQVLGVAISVMAIISAIYFTL